MTGKEKRGIPAPKEAPKKPGVNPSSKTATPDITAENSFVKREERAEISPYDFPPPDKGLFPQIF